MVQPRSYQSLYLKHTNNLFRKMQLLRLPLYWPSWLDGTDCRLVLSSLKNSFSKALPLTAPLSGAPSLSFLSSALRPFMFTASLVISHCNFKLYLHSVTHTFVIYHTAFSSNTSMLSLIPVLGARNP